MENVFWFRVVYVYIWLCVVKGNFNNGNYKIIIRVVVDFLFNGVILLKLNKFIIYVFAVCGCSKFVDVKK